MNESRQERLVNWNSCGVASSLVPGNVKEFLRHISVWSHTGSALRNQTQLSETLQGSDHRYLTDRSTAPSALIPPHLGYITSRIQHWKRESMSEGKKRNTLHLTSPHPPPRSLLQVLMLPLLSCITQSEEADGCVTNLQCSWRSAHLCR